MILIHDKFTEKRTFIFFCPLFFQSVFFLSRFAHFLPTRSQWLRWIFNSRRKSDGPADQTNHKHYIYIARPNCPQTVWKRGASNWLCTHPHTQSLGSLVCVYHTQHLKSCTSTHAHTCTHTYSKPLQKPTTVCVKLFQLLTIRAVWSSCELANPRERLCY